MWSSVEKFAKKAEEAAKMVTENEHVQSVAAKAKKKTKKVSDKVKTHFSASNESAEQDTRSTPTTYSPKSRKIKVDADGAGDKSEILWTNGSVSRMPSLRVFGKDTTIVVADESKRTKKKAKNKPQPEDDSESNGIENAETTVEQVIERGIEEEGIEREMINLPILIFPGMASSGLYVQESGLNNDKYQGKRLWMNAGFLAASKTYNIDVNSSMKNEGIMSSYVDDSSSRNSFVDNVEHFDREPSTHSEISIHDDDEADDEASVKFAKIEDEFQIRSAWLYHVSLDKNMVDERPGNRVRPYDGLKACEWLVDDALGKPAAVVWADTIQFLEKEMGYIRGKNLDAVPYDWRLPPMCVESRDGYFTQTIKRVELMYEENDGLPILMCCHSMGCRMGHYFLNFAQREKGRAWIDKHIHTYMPVGAPHCGSPLTMKLGATGAGLIGFVEDAMISLDEGLIMYRSWGSGPWLASRDLPSGILPNCIVRREGELGIKVNSEINVGSLFTNREKPPRELRLTIIFRDKIQASTDFVPVKIDNETNPASMLVSFEETFYFAVPYLGDGDGDIGSLVFFLEEPSSGMLYSQNKTRTQVRNATKWARGFKKGMTKMYRSVVKKMGSVTRVAVCDKPQELKVSNFTETSSTTMDGTPVIEMVVPFCKFERVANSKSKSQKNANDYTIKGEERTNNNSALVPYIMDDDEEKEDREQEELALVPYVFDPDQQDKTIGSISLHVKYSPPPDFQNQPSPCTTKFAVMSEDTPVPPIVSKKKKFNTISHDKIVYDAWHGRDLLDQDGFCQSLFDVFQEYYERDDLGPSTKSALDAPPVNCVRSIYGINVPTEVCVVYRKEPVVVIGDSKADCRFRVDTSAAFPKFDSSNTSDKDGEPLVGSQVMALLKQYDMKDGIINETPNTLQNVPGTNEKRRCCGDGTVPYWSMVHCLKWKDSIPTVTVDELEGAIHRSILSDKRFHALLQQHCTVDNPRPSTTTLATLESGVSEIALSTILDEEN